MCGPSPRGFYNCSKTDVVQANMARRVSFGLNIESELSREDLPAAGAGVDVGAPPAAASSSAAAPNKKRALLPGGEAGGAAPPKKKTRLVRK